MEADNSIKTIATASNRGRCYCLGSYPSLFLYAAFMGIIENLFNLGLFVKSLSLNHVVRDYTECTVFLQCAPAYPQDFGKFLVRKETFTVEE